MMPVSNQRQVLIIAMRDGKNYKGRTSLRLLAGAVVAIIALEFALRAILGLGSPLLFDTDQRYGYFPKSDQHLRRFFAAIDTNDFGMRSPKVLGRKAPGEHRILFVGDSVAFGTTYVGQRDIFVERIGKMLSRSGAPVSVLNAASPGWAPANELAFIEAKGTYDADWVVLVYNTKDLVQPFAPFEAALQFPVENPSTALSELWTRYVKPRVFKDAPAVDPGSTQDDGRPSMDDAAKVLQTIAATRRAAVSRGARMVILFSPAVTPDVGRNRAAWDQAFSNLQEWAARENVPILDMTQAVSNSDPAKIYFDGIHLRPAGDALYADTFVRRFGAELSGK
jgi:hypothetical protein